MSAEEVVRAIIADLTDMARRQVPAWDIRDAIEEKYGTLGGES